MILTSVEFSEQVPFMERRGSHLYMRVFAEIGGRKFEFVRLQKSADVEVYDFPDSWDGISRFLGYAPTEAGAMLETVARRHVGLT